MNIIIICYHEPLVYSSVFMYVRACMHVHLGACVCVNNVIWLPAVIIILFLICSLQNQLAKLKVLRTLVQHWEATHLLAMLSKAKPTEIKTTLSLIKDTVV